MTNVITTNRLLLRPFRDADGTTAIAFLNDFEVSKWLSRVPHPFTATDFVTNSPDGSSLWPELAAVELDGAIVGAVTTQGHLGFWLARAYWGRGIITEAARALITRFFATNVRADLVSGYFVGNAGSARVLDKLGFQETSRDLTTCVARGKKLPHVNMLLLRDRWGLGE